MDSCILVLMCLQFFARKAVGASSWGQRHPHSPAAIAAKRLHLASTRPGRVLGEGADFCAGRHVYAAPLPAEISLWEKEHEPLYWQPVFPVGNQSAAAAAEMVDLLSYAVPEGTGDEAGGGARSAAQFLDRLARARADILQSAWGEEEPLHDSVSFMQLERLVVRRMRAHPCLVSDPRAADAVYVPLRIGNARVRGRDPASDAAVDAQHERELDALTRQPAWALRGGKDHFVVFSQESYVGDMGFLPESVARLVSTRNVFDGENVLSTPYFHGFHPSTQAALDRWRGFVAGLARPFLFTLHASPDVSPQTGQLVRRVVAWQCSLSPKCTEFSVDRAGLTEVTRKWLSMKRTRDSARAVLAMNLVSSFCLHPRGDKCGRFSIYSSMTAGCIPVVFEECSLGGQHRAQLPPNDPPFYVLIPLEKLRQPRDIPPGGSCRPNQNSEPWPTNSMGPRPWCLEHNVTEAELPPTEGDALWIEDVLSAIPPEEVTAMRLRMLELAPRVTYGGAQRPDGDVGAPEFEDALDLMIHAVAARARGEPVQAAALVGGATPPSWTNPGRGGGLPGDLAELGTSAGSQKVVGKDELGMVAAFETELGKELPDAN